jgi:pimeloyl-ACP methyl ester carboxylesterase
MENEKNTKDLNNNNNNKEKKSSILFVHGFTQNSDIFRKRLKVILKSLQSKFKNHEMLIPDAPHLLNPEVK